MQLSAGIRCPTVSPGLRHQGHFRSLLALPDGDPGAILLIEFYGNHAEELPPRVDALSADLRQHGWGSLEYRAPDAVSQARIWKLRRLARS